MSGFKETKFNEMPNKVEDTSDTAKKPVLAFKLQKHPSKVKTVLQGSVKKVFLNPEEQSEAKIKENKLSFPTERLNENESMVQIDEQKSLQLSYVEPSWGGITEDIYKIEVLKAGVILETLDLAHKNYYTVGTSLSCDISLTHESISQFHAILQYRKISDSENKKGMYIYDLNTTHGTFLNGDRIESNKYIFLQSGYIISFGDSQKKYILQSLKDNEVKEAELSAGELQELKRLESEEQEKLDKQRLLKENEERLKREAEIKGINWGIAEDIDEDSKSTDSSEDPESDNEELFLSNPKKALRDWFKWEGYDLEYQTEDRGFGQYSCWIDLTLDAVGTTERVEVHIAGDKMKAIDECALKACKILNKYGYLRQAHEEKKSTSRNWEEVDYYDSDEDNFLDRTGVIEKKRQQRMQMDGKLNAQIETYNLLHDKHTKIVERIANLKKLIDLQKVKQDEMENSDEDALDAFMSKLNTSTLNKTEIRNMQMELHNLEQEKILVQHSMNISKSVNTDPSKPCTESITEKTKNGHRFDF